VGAAWRATTATSCSCGAAELRKIRDYERPNANRKAVLDAVEGKLAAS